MQSVTVLAVLGAVVAIVGAKITFKSAKVPAISPRHDLVSVPFSVKLDHFSPLDDHFVNFTYTQNIDYYRNGGPIFIYINDAGEFTTELLEIGLMHDIAIDAGAALITADNRFFRSNIPTENATFENLQYLTIEQTINDIGRMIQVVRENLDATNASIILWGSGMGATLATWTAQKYPNLVNGVWSSSGVFEHIVFTNEPYEQLTRTLTSVGGQECADNMLNAFDNMEFMMFRGQSSQLGNLFGTCFPPFYFYDEEAAGFFAGIIQIIIDYINIHHYEGVASLCADLNSTSTTEIEALSQWTLNAFNQDACLDLSFFYRIYEASLSDWDDIAELNWNDTINVAYPFMSRPLFYLRCTQLGIFPTNVNSRTSFGNVIGQDMYFYGCSDAFGEQYNYELLQDAVKQLAIKYGGKNPALHNVLYTNGELDTQFAFGITEPYAGTDVFVRNIPNYARSGDLWSASDNDSDALTSVKNLIRQLVLRWGEVAADQ